MPASASATAEASPARPPPITRTLCEGIPLPPTRHPRCQEILKFLGARQRNAPGKDVESTLFDSCEKAAVCPNQRPQSSAAVRVHFVHQRRALFVKLPRARSLDFQKALDLRRQRAAQLGRRHAKAVEIFLRQIHAAHLEIAPNVAQDVSKLERKTEALGQIGRARVAKTENVQTGEPYGSRHAIAVLG